MNIEYKLLKGEIKEISRIIEFFISPATDTVLFEEIVKKCVHNNLHDNSKEISLLHNGSLSPLDYLFFYKDAKIPKLVDNVLEMLVKNYVILPSTSCIFSEMSNRYEPNKDYAKFLSDRGLILNLIFGFQYIVEKYCESIVKIIPKDINGDSYIGTGFIISTKTDKDSLQLIITNNHVLSSEFDKKIISASVLNNNDEVIIENIDLDNLIKDVKNDIAIIENPKKITNSLHLYQEFDVLDEIVTIGYPSIPLTDKSYQLVHKGEINSSVKSSLNNRDLIVFSSKTSGGNSGGPIINKFGLVLGVISEDLFEQDQFEKKGKLPYHAGTPSIKVFELLKDLIN